MSKLRQWISPAVYKSFFKSSLLQMFIKVGVLIDFARNIHKKTPVMKPIFNKVAELKDCNFIKKRLQRKCFHVNIAKSLRTASHIEHLRWLLSFLHQIPIRFQFLTQK